jgi:hypothetical protein
VVGDWWALWDEDPPNQIQPVACWALIRPDDSMDSFVSGLAPCADGLRPPEDAATFIGYWAMPESRVEDELEGEIARRRAEWEEAQA